MLTQTEILESLRKSLNPEIFLRTKTTDIDFIKDAIHIVPEIYMYLPDNFKENEEIVAHTMKIDIELRDEIPKYLISKDLIFQLLVQGVSEPIFELFKPDSFDGDFFLKCFMVNKKILRYLEYSPTMKEEALLQLREKKYLQVSYNQSKGFSIFGFISKEWKNDKEMLIEIVKIHGRNLIYASDRLKNDKDVVLQAIETHAYSIEYASEEMKNNKEVVMAAVKKDGRNLRFASLELRNDKEIVLESVRMDGYNLQYASDALKNDSEIISIAFEHNEYLKYFPEEWNQEKLKALNSMKSHTMNRQISQQVSNQKEEMMKLVAMDGYNLRFASEELRNDRELVSEALKTCFYCFEYASNELKNQKDLVLEAVKKDGDNLQFVSQFLKLDKEVVMMAVKKDGYTLRYATDLKYDMDLVWFSKKYFKSIRSVNCFDVNFKFKSKNKYFL
jgi:CxxC motif-containing protein